MSGPGESAPYLRANIKAMADRRFPPNKAAVEGVAVIRSLSLNECPYPPSERVIEAIAEAARTGNRYPDPIARVLAARLATRMGVEPWQVVFGNGSDELIALGGWMALEPGKRAVMPAPSFQGYQIAAAVNEAEAAIVPLRADGVNDIDGLLAAVTPETRILYMSTVNNPSGGMVTDDELRRVVHETPDHVLLFIDDAYHEFGVDAGGPDAVKVALERNGGWVVSRTVSKAFALAGLRMGYAICGDHPTMQAFLKLKPTFNANALAQAAVTAALDDPEHARMILDSAARERGRLEEGLRAMGLDPLPSAANFVSVELPVAAADVANAMLQHGVLVRAWADPGWERFLRLSVGLPEDTDATLAALESALGTVTA